MRRAFGSGLAALVTLGASWHRAEAQIDQVPVWRLQLGLATCDVEDAGTDDRIYVQTGSSARFYIDYGGDDFERDHRKVYDVDPGAVGVSVIGDIRGLTLGKDQPGPQGSVPAFDGWCMRQTELYVNNSPVPIFRGPQGRFWIDGDDGRRPTLTYSSGTLRSNPAWTGANLSLLTRRPTTLSRDLLESMIESVVGNGVSQNDLYWGHHYGQRWVEVTRKDARTLHVDLDLAYNSAAWDPEVDVDFDLGVACSQSVINLTPANYQVDVHSAWYKHLATLGLTLIENAVVESRAIKRLTLPAQATAVPECPQLSATSGGSIALGW